MELLFDHIECESSAFCGVMRAVGTPLLLRLAKVKIGDPPTFRGLS